MRIIRKRCLGLDLHKKQITGHLRVHRGSETEPERMDIRFGTMPADLLRLREWVVEHQVTDVVMESTSVYWMHVYELFESVTTPAVVNAAHVKKVPGRKTDVCDAQWLSELHAHGLLRLSFVPPKEIRELRSITRYRVKLVAMRTSARNRTIKMIEMAGIKLSSVVCDSFGRTGRAILDALAQGAVEASTVVTVAKGSLRKKTAELHAALQTPLSDNQRELLTMHLRAYDAIDAQIAETEIKLAERAQPYAAAIEKLDAVPGINPLAAITVLAETGLEMSVYRNAHHLTSLAGLAPGNSISADKRRRICHAEGESLSQTHLCADRMGCLPKRRQLPAFALQPLELSNRQKQGHRGHGAPHLDHRLPPVGRRSLLPRSRFRVLRSAEQGTFHQTPRAEA